VSGLARNDPGGARSTTSQKAVVVVGGLLLFAQVALLALSLREIGSTEDHVTALDERVERAERVARPLYDEASGFAEDVEPAAGDAAAALHSARQFLRPVADDGVDVSAALDRLPNLALSAQRLAAAALPAAQSADAVLQAAEDQDLVTRAVESRFILGELLEVQRETLETQRETLTVQIRSLETQRRAVRKLGRSLGIQRSTLKHVRSIDRKTGGPIAPP
jgi:chaperonin cofactor prefoldin